MEQGESVEAEELRNVAQGHRRVKFSCLSEKGLLFLPYTIASVKTWVPIILTVLCNVIIATVVQTSEEAEQSCTLLHLQLVFMYELQFLLGTFISLDQRDGIGERVLDVKPDGFLLQVPSLAFISCVIVFESVNLPGP